ncbi:MAG: YtxH domain-containing protein [Deltaproteobacteria bacterium]|nr:MAG: YtxH domain-containing protein [Deltaproteobacteria bacterium]TMB37261.1 MAG: YtxH domain-containing protein [Deltaproteobacteria bacterium]
MRRFRRGKYVSVHVVSGHGRPPLEAIMVKDIRKQGLKALKYLQDIDKDDVLEAIGLEERSSAWASALGTIGIFLLGCLVGAGIGLAFAPKSGEEFRNELGDRMRRKADELGVNQDVMSRSQMPVT